MTNLSPPQEQPCCLRRNMPSRHREARETSPLRNHSTGTRYTSAATGNENVPPEPSSGPQFTWRATLVGLLVGSIVCFSNMYFGLQTGWVSMMSMPSSLIGFALFKSLKSHLDLPFTPVENVLVQTVAVAVGSMPLSGGFVGVIPALEKLLKPTEGGPLNLSAGQLAVWSFGVAFFGVYFAVPLRKQVIIKEKLKFPSGTATAQMISVLHGRGSEKSKADTLEEGRRPSSASGSAHAPTSPVERSTSWATKIKILLYSFIISGLFTLVSYFLPILRDVPIFGSMAASIWLWTLNPSPAYVGQGIIMGAPTTLHMLLGAIIGWAVLSPLAKSKGWAPGPVGDWNEGSKGWIVWVSLSVMFADSFISLGNIVVPPLFNFAERSLRTRKMYESLHSGPSQGGTDSNLRRGPLESDLDLKENGPHDDEVPPEFLVKKETVIFGLILSGLLCITTVSLVFDQIPLYAIFLAFFVALLLSIMGVRALGQTDLNPVSGISKLTQLLFALIIPASNKNAVLINLVAGAVSEAGAQQAGDLMQDLKTGHLLGASPKAQFYGQLIGSIVGAVISAYVYKLYNCVYDMPSKLFPVPTAYIWIDCSRLFYGHGLPPHAQDFAIVFAVIFTVSTLIRANPRFKSFSHYVPGGIAFAIGMYNVPSFTLARVIGGAIDWWWKKYMLQKFGDTPLVILASGLILGEGIFSIVNLTMASLSVPHF